MATGSWAPNSSTNKKIRLTMTLSYSGSPSSGSVTVRKVIKATCDYRIDDSNNTFITSGTGGSYNGSKNLDFPSSNSTITLYDGTSTVSLNYGSKKTVSASASLTGIDYIGSSVKATVSESLTLPARPYSTPSAVTGLSATRVSDTRNNLAWTRNSTTAGYYQGIKVYRSTDGGSYVLIATLSGSATGYADTTTSANHSYRYKVQPYNSTGSADTLSSTLYNTPSAPSNLVAVKTGVDAVALSWNNTARTETVTGVWRSTDGGSNWTQIATTGENATGYTDSSLPAGTVIYRVRNGRGSLISAWSNTSNSVTTTQAPAAPTLNVKPAGVIPTGTASATVGWLHNTLDGSAQSAAEIEVTRAGVITTYTVATASTYAIDISSMTDKQVVSVRVRTKGLHANYGAWSSSYSFTVKTAPQLVITSPTDDTSVMTEVPIAITWDYIDTTACAEWTLLLYHIATGALVHTAGGIAETAYSLNPATHVPINGEAYSIVLTARSGSSLTATVERTFSVAYTPPAVPSLEADVDTENGAVQLAAFFGDGAGPTATYLSIEQEDGTIIATGLTDGTVVIDPTPLLNRVNTYRVRAHTDAGLTSEALLVEVDVQVGPWFIWNFGDGLMQTARLKGNPNWSHSYTTDQQLFEMAGRSYPVLMTGRGLAEEIDFSGTARTDEQREQLDALGIWARKAVYREPHGVKKSVKCEVASSEAGGPRKTEYQVKMTVVD